MYNQLDRCWLRSSRGGSSYKAFLTLPPLLVILISARPTSLTNCIQHIRFVRWTRREDFREVSFFTRMGGRLFVTSYRQFFLVPPFDRAKKTGPLLTNEKKILAPLDKIKKILVPPFRVKDLHPST